MHQYHKVHIITHMRNYMHFLIQPKPVIFYASQNTYNIHKNMHINFSGYTFIYKLKNVGNIP